jgi:dUTP pyrophosphatase
MKRLLIKPVDNRAIEYYESHTTYHPGDCGVDLFVLEDIEICPGETKLIDLGIQCEMVNLVPANNINCSYYLYPRSSISTKTPLILANSTGIIDSGYRGNLIAAVKYVPNNDDLNNLVLKTVDYLLKNDIAYLNQEGVTIDKIRENVVDKLQKFTIKAGTRLVQICTPNLEPIDIKLVTELSNSSRGSGGFGSTDNYINAV